MERGCVSISNKQREEGRPPTREEHCETMWPYDVIDVAAAWRGESGVAKRRKAANQSAGDWVSGFREKVCARNIGK